MQIYSQRDPRWSQKRLGHSPLTIGRFGCTITSIAMLATYFKDMITPLDLSLKVDFTPEGYLIWQSINKPPTPTWGLHFNFVQRQVGRNDKDILAALADPNRAVILNVAGGSHWVVATGRNGSLFAIADPWLGDRSTMKRYQNNIVGAAYFQRK